MAYANILDAILNTPSEYRTGKTASTALGDGLLDEPSRHNYARTTAGRRAQAAATGEGELAEAAGSLIKTQTKTASSDIRTIEQALKFAKELPGMLRDRPVAARNRIASAKGTLDAAVARLTRLSNKTVAQMQQDGATKLADYLNPGIVPSWAKQARADMALIQAIHVIAKGGTNTKAASTEEVLKERKLSDAEVAGYVQKLLNKGGDPKDALAKLKKLAELQLFDRSFATDKVRADANVVGIDFLEPNAYMDNAPSTYERQEVKLGSKIQFEGVTDLKTARQVSEWATRIVRRAIQAKHRPEVGVKQAKAGQDQGYRRNQQDVTIRTSSTIEKKASSDTFTAADALKLHNAGQDLSTIYRQATAKVGSAQAVSTMKKFIAGLKGTKTKVALTQIDCTLLPQKLGTSNAIIGASKCGSCTYRKGMHCGFTGGTLLSFPGLEKTASNHKKYASSPKDGYGLLNEFEMAKTAAAHDIDINVDGPGYGDIELNTSSKVNL